jgi:hypothetical protein
MWMLVLTVLVLITLRVVFPDNFRDFASDLKSWWSGPTGLLVRRVIAGVVLVVFLFFFWKIIIVHSPV